MRDDTHSLDSLKREAKRLRRAYESGDRQAKLHVGQWLGARPALNHADFLHIVARERGFESWPMLKIAAEAQGLSRAEAVERLKQALYLGQKAWVEKLLSTWPDLVEGQFHLACAMYNLDAVEDALARDPSLVSVAFGPRRPILHLAFSRYCQIAPEKAADAILVAEALVRAGADVNDGYPSEPGSTHLLSALYGALGHAVHLPLGRWLLEQGADPNDNESLYHATEQRDGLAVAMLLAHGARVDGTNALYRAMDFDDVAQVRMMLDAGADPNAGVANHPSGEAPIESVGLHHAAKRGCGAEMIELLVSRGAHLDTYLDGVGAYAVARLYGNDVAAKALSRLGAPTDLPEGVEELLSGSVPVNADALPDVVLESVTDVAALPGRLAHLKALIAAGMPWDRPDRMGLTPVQIAGWQGQPEVVAYLLKMRPDLGHVNAYGGTLLSTIIHGSENAPHQTGQDHIACLRLALEEGVALPRPAIRHAGREDVAAFLEDWAQRYPGQVVEHGIA